MRLTRTLLLDEDGVYDPSHFNDRLLLGLKGTMSEVELHLIRARLRGGLLQKARRGELGGRLPTGLVYGPRGQVELDPDRQVQESFRHLFKTFRRTGSALAVVKALRQEGLKFPHRVWGGAHEGELVWSKLAYYRVDVGVILSALCGGIRFWPHTVCAIAQWSDEANQKEVAPEEWYAFIPNAHAGYISWEEYQENQKKLQENATAIPVPATTDSSARRSRFASGFSHLREMRPTDACAISRAARNLVSGLHLWAAASRYGEKQCQRISGHDLDRADEQLLLETVNPLNLEVALADRTGNGNATRGSRSPSASGCAAGAAGSDLARRRYLQVDPDNRLVADQLEADWNSKLRALHSAQEEYEQQKQNEQKIFRAEQREKILALAADFPKVWNDPNLPYRERKRMARLLLEDVTLRKEEKVIAQVRFKGGARGRLELPLPLPFCVLSRTRPEVVEAIDALLGTA